MRGVFIPTIGNRVKIIYSSNPILIGVEGIILGDTKNTLVIKKDNGRIIRVGKKGCIFEIYINDRVVRVAGEDLMGDYIRRLSRV